MVLIHVKNTEQEACARVCIMIANENYHVFESNTSCADPESFVRWGQTLQIDNIFILVDEGRIQVPL